MQNGNAINWFEIPVTDFDRALAFYQNMLGIEMPTTSAYGYKMGYFPSLQEGKVNGAFCFGEGYIPSGAGSLLYINAGPDLNIALHKVHDLGGRILVPKTMIDEQNGYYAFIVDTEGNRIALHSNG
jgi:predicted enzyme related to lactoylglutathione lyase